MKQTKNAVRSFWLSFLFIELLDLFVGDLIPQRSWEKADRIPIFNFA